MTSTEALETSERELVDRLLCTLPGTDQRDISWKGLSVRRGRLETTVHLQVEDGNDVRSIDIKLVSAQASDRFEKSGSSDRPRLKPIANPATVLACQRDIIDNLSQIMFESRPCQWWVPKVVGFTDDAVAIEHEDGRRLLAETSRILEHSDFSLVESAGVWLRALHRSPNIEGSTRFLDTREMAQQQLHALVAYLEPQKIGRRVATLADRVERLLRRLPHETAVTNVHGDFGLHRGLIVSDHRIYVEGTSGAWSGPAAFDLACWRPLGLLLAGVETADLTRLEQSLHKGYGDQLPTIEHIRGYECLVILDRLVSSSPTRSGPLSQAVKWTTRRDRFAALIAHLECCLEEVDA